MKRLRQYQGLAPSEQGASAAIGNFDGVHRGHQMVIDIARNAGADIGAPLGIVTFEPHPRQLFAPQAPAFRLMNAEAKANRLAKLGVSHLHELPFDKALAQLSPRDFAQQVLAEGLGLRHVVVGADFCFGKGRAGNAQDLKALGETLGFSTTIVELLSESENSKIVSSTNIRRALSEGHPRAARDMLGHWHRIDGPVIHGEKRGRELGYPTANMALAGLHIPMHGVYAVLVDVLSGPQAGSYHGVASLGVRPMFGENQPNLETHLFDFSGDLYDQHLSVGLVARLRGEEKFDGLAALVAQMDRDSAEARALLAGL